MILIIAVLLVAAATADQLQFLSPVNPYSSVAIDTFLTPPFRTLPPSTSYGVPVAIHELTAAPTYQNSIISSVLPTYKSTPVVPTYNKPLSYASATYAPYSTSVKFQDAPAYAVSQNIEPRRSNYVDNMDYVVPKAKYYNYGNVIPIVRSSYDSDSKGNYRFDYETGNDISHQETGRVKDSETIEKQGSFSYQSPEGKTISLNYIADENGFRAAGDHLPTPPPIPKAILRSLEYNAAAKARGIADDGQYHPENHISRGNHDDGQYHPELYDNGQDDGQYHHELNHNYYEPVVSSQYLVPTIAIPNQYVTPKLSNSYLTPSVYTITEVPKISNQYLTPRISNQYLTPKLNNQYLTPKLNNQYLAPFY